MYNIRYNEDIEIDVNCICPICNKNKNIQVKKKMYKEIHKLKNALNKTKKKLDLINFTYKNNSIRWESMLDYIMSHMNPYKKEKYKIAYNIKEKYISNAWLKCFEIIQKYKFFNNMKNIYHFDNASLPGAFILATKYIIKNYYPNKVYEWKASSLYDNKKSHLGDDYNLFKDYPYNWTMSDTNNGDITDTKVINDITSALESCNFKTNFYTSDLGFDVSHDYLNQESIHFAANTGQILTCLKILNTGGICVIKHFTYFEEYTLYYLSIFSKLFREFKLYKPKTSKMLNSEIYLIGIDFTHKTILKNQLIKELEHCLNHNIFRLSKYFKYPNYFIFKILPHVKTHIGIQIQNLNNVIDITSKIQRYINKYNIHTLDNGFLYDFVLPLIKSNIYKPRIEYIYNEDVKILAYI